MKKEKIKIEELNRVKKIHEQKVRKKTLIGALFTLITIVLIVIFIINPNIRKNDIYNQGMAFYNNEEYTLAVTTFESLGNFKNSNIMLENSSMAIEYSSAITAYESGNYSIALESLEKLGDFKDSKIIVTKIKNAFNGPDSLFNDQIKGTWISQIEPYKAYEFTTPNGRIIEHLGGGSTNSISDNIYDASKGLVENKKRGIVFIFKDNSMEVNGNTFVRGNLK